MQLRLTTLAMPAFAASSACLQCLWVPSTACVPAESLSALGWCAGAFGTVFRARLDDVLPVAVKMLEPGSLGQKEVGALMNEVCDKHMISAAHRS